MAQGFDFVVFSHLRWEFVFQRPQHLFSRFAAKHRVIFVEEPLQDDGPVRWEIRPTESNPNVIICRLHTPEENPGFNRTQLALMSAHIPELIRQVALGEHVVWFYTPTALPLVEHFTPKAVIYDCMDELSGFLGAPPELIDREEKLLKLADVVFTGGPSLFRAKQHRHPNVHCFPSSVDAAHYAKACPGMNHEAPDQSGLAKPRLGYFGVIDERIDLELLDHLARTRPEWQILMVGPVVKIERAMLPQHSNIRYFGQRNYAELPSYLVGWDVCMLPFARNQSTKFISPTKTLEYMAAERMIVSTPITDVAEPYGKLVYLGETHEQFVAACERALNISGSERSERVRSMRDVLSRTSWDSTAARMLQLIESAIKKTRDLEEGVFVPASAKPVKSAPKTLIIGAGPTGLSAAYHLGENSVLLEQHSRVGGWCRSVEDKGFTFDHAGHIMFSNDPYVHRLYRMLIGDNIHWQNREAWIYSKGVYTRYPFQGSLYGLPPEVIRECIVGAIEARFGSQKRNANGTSNGKNIPHSHTGGHAKPAGKNGDSNGANCVEDCCADGVLEAALSMANSIGANASGANASGANATASHEPKNFEEFIYKVWGAGIAKHFAIPYNRKLWAVPLTEMETSWLGGRVPMPDLEEMIDGALSPAPKPMGPNARFGYPLKGGFQSLMNGFLPHLKGELKLNSRVRSISTANKVATLDDGTEQRWEYLISTMPLPLLIRALGNGAPEEIREAARGLRHVSVRCVNIGVGRENLTEKHWIYYPEDTVFHRIFVQGNASPYCNPPGGFGLTCEITYSEHKPLPSEGDELIRKCIEDCRRVGMIAQDDPILTANQVDLPYAYVVYDHGRARNVSVIREWLTERNVILAGRYSEWEYYNSDHAFLAGKRAAEKVQELERQRSMRKLMAPAWAAQRSQAQGD